MKDLTALETLTRISQMVRSQLDPGYLELLGEGHYGQVYQAKKNGRQVAVKILKEINQETIKYFESEVNSLRLVFYLFIYYLFIYLYRSIRFSIDNLNRVLWKKTTIINYH